MTALTAKDDAREPSQLVVTLAVAAAAIPALAITNSAHGSVLIWPADGMILAFMLGRFQRRPWLTLCMGKFGVLVAAALLQWSPILTALFTVSTASCLAVIYLVVTRFIGAPALLESRGLLKFLPLVTLMSLFTGSARALILQHYMHIPLLEVIVGAAITGAVGYAVMTPLVLVLTNPGAAAPWGARKLFRTASVIGVYTAGLLAVFGQTRYPLLFVIPLGLMWVAYTVDFSGVALAVLLTAVVAALLTMVGRGPINLIPGGEEERTLALQLFLAIVTCTTLPIAALMAEHARLKSGLVGARRAAEAANDAKSVFLATVSHEIRTPLNGVLGMAQVMSMGELSSVQRERLSVVQRSGEVLLELLNDVLDISKIEAGKLELEHIEFDLGEILDGAVHAYQSLAAEKGLAIVLQMDGAEGVYLGDPTRVRQVIYNLVSNALKFTSAGEIRVTAEPADSGLRLRVSDTGIGIPEDKLGSLFDKFTQVDESTTRRFGGSGLGLSICRELVEIMGGSITVQSRAGEGSIFLVDLPLLRVGEARAGVSPLEVFEFSADLSSLRILAAEDNPTNQLVLKTLLHSVGVDLVIVEDGQQALEAWKRERWDLILMDIQMPVMDGPSATRAIRQAEQLGRLVRTPIVALTADTFSHQVQAYLHAGMDAHLAKPIQASALFEVVASAAEGPGSASVASAQAQASA